MIAQVKFFMLDHEETCFNRIWNHFHEFWMKNVNAIQSRLVGLMESSMNENVLKLQEMYFKSR